MSIDTLIRALRNQELVGDYRLAYLAAGESGGYISAEKIQLWVNCDFLKALDIIEDLVIAGHFVRNGLRVHCPQLQEDDAPCPPPPPKAIGGEISSMARFVVMQRDGPKCRYCGASDGPFHIDHVVPKSRGGSGDPENLVVACATCNLKKGPRTPEEMGWAF